MPGSESTSFSEAQSRVVQITTSHGDPVVYSGNPAELPGARFEMNLCLERIGAFKLLIQHGASRLKSGVIAVDNPSNILFVTQDLVDPDQGSYTNENPCPDTPTRIARTNARRAITGQPRFDGIPNISIRPCATAKSRHASAA